ncbi:MAG: CPBP family intramembrane metalloprotease [Acidobacteria bacterium]|nr:CPBP family intramembrane metalloprotease [Acidobacteriota bacterium]MBK8148185.1 CPBP family intramembrane metalloprotease [Acidobacteriota bacterium]MBK8811798.1 CPBP family intramembrane metalloprotease [Acidobacteriota bacterium]
MQNEELIEHTAAVELDRSDSGSDAVSPDDPSWGLVPAIIFWIVSVLLILILPALAVLPYAMMMGIDSQNLGEFLQGNKTALILNIAAIIPAHILTLVISWFIISRTKRVGYFEALGWDFGSFRAWHGIAIIGGFFAFAAVVGHYFPEQDNQLLQVLRSSREATILIALVATFSAPFVEEVVYRGVLYSAARKTMGTASSTVLVTLLFTIVHVPQYLPSYSTIFLLLSLSLVLTLVRARTGRLLPCVVLHFVFNGIQSALLILQPYFPQPLPDANAPAIYLWLGM